MHIFYNHYPNSRCSVLTSVTASWPDSWKSRIFTLEKPPRSCIDQTTTSTTIISILKAFTHNQGIKFVFNLNIDPQISNILEGISIPTRKIIRRKDTLLYDISCFVSNRKLQWIFVMVESFLCRIINLSFCKQCSNINWSDTINVIDPQIVITPTIFVCLWRFVSK